MPTVLLDAVEVERFGARNLYTSYRFEFPSVELSRPSDLLKLPLRSPEGRLVEFRIASLSSNMTISVRTAENVSLPSIDEILHIENINCIYAGRNLDILFTNRDGITDPETDSGKATANAFLYLVIVNKDASNDTGPIQIEVIIEKM